MLIGACNPMLCPVHMVQANPAVNITALSRLISTGTATSTFLCAMLAGLSYVRAHVHTQKKTLKTPQKTNALNLPQHAVNRAISY